MSKADHIRMLIEAADFEDEDIRYLDGTLEDIEFAVNALKESLLDEAGDRNIYISLRDIEDLGYHAGAVEGAAVTLKELAAKVSRDGKG